MTFPVGTIISTANVDSVDDNPSLARADIYDLIVAFNALVASVNAANGVLTLNGSAKVAASYLPAIQNITGTVQLQPTTGIVNIRNVLRLQQVVTADLGTALGTASPTAGDLVYLTDGDAGQPCLGAYDGTAWRIVRFMTAVGDVGGDLASSAVLACDADVV